MVASWCLWGLLTAVLKVSVNLDEALAALDRTEVCGASSVRGCKQACILWSCPLAFAGWCGWQRRATVLSLRSKGGLKWLCRERISQCCDRGGFDEVLSFGPALT